MGSIEEQQARMRNNERQKQLVDDTAKLLSLANELKADVDKSSKDTLSLDVVRKADEIEKLAHSVKEKMKGQ
jgi:nitric oxide reductase activation protein